MALTGGTAEAQLAVPDVASQDPRVLVPSDSAAEPAIVLPPPNVDNSRQNNNLPSMPTPVAVGDLGIVEGPVAGTLNDFNGGLGQDMWAGSNRSDVEMLLRRAPTTLMSQTSRLLFRKVLLTEAPLPVGLGTQPFNALRIQLLLDAGELSDAGALAARIRSRDAQTQRMQADAMLYAGRDIEVCGEATSERLQSAEPFWVSLRAYCYHFDGDTLALELTRSVMEQQGIADAAFFHLLDAFDVEEQTPPDVIASPNAIHVRLLLRHDLPIPLNAVSSLGMPVSVITAMLPDMAIEMRRPVAEQVFRSGVLPASVMADVFDATEFASGDLNLSTTIARSEPMMAALERIHHALKIDGRADRRAELVHLAFLIGRNEGLLAQIAELFADDAAAIYPAPNWEAWSPLMMRGLILAERDSAADRWYAMLNPQIPAHLNAARDTTFLLSIVRREQPYITDAQGPLADIALQSLNLGVPLTDLARNTIILGLFDVLGLDMPPEARSQAQQLVTMGFPGRSPPPFILQRIENASLTGKKGELGLAILDALGPRGAKDMAPNVIVFFVRALRTAGMIESAQALANEAIFTWQDG